MACLGSPRNSDASAWTAITVGTALSSVSLALVACGSLEVAVMALP